MIYASAVTCDRHEGCWNALVESGSPPYHLFRPVHGSLQSARDVAERLAARCAAQEPGRQARLDDWRPGWLGIEYQPCAGCGHALFSGAVVWSRPPHDDDRRVYHLDCIPLHVTNALYQERVRREQELREGAG